MLDGVTNDFRMIVDIVTFEQQLKMKEVDMVTY